MSEHEKLVEEFRSLRRAGRNRPIDLKAAPNLVWHTGRGNVDVTAQFLKSLLSVDDPQIQAALASLGFRGSGNIERRMSDFAVHAHRESTRTVRRWADEGFARMADLVLEWSEEEGNDHAQLASLFHATGPARCRMVWMTA